MGETIETNIGKKCKAVNIDYVFSNIQANFGSITLNRGFFQFLGTMQLSHKHSLEIIIVIDTYIWQGHMCETKIVVV